MTLMCLTCTCYFSQQEETPELAQRPLAKSQFDISHPGKVPFYYFCLPCNMMIEMIAFDRSLYLWTEVPQTFSRVSWCQLVTALSHCSAASGRLLTEYRFELHLRLVQWLLHVEHFLELKCRVKMCLIFFFFFENAIPSFSPHLECPIILGCLLLLPLLLMQKRA